MSFQPLQCKTLAFKSKKDFTHSALEIQANDFNQTTGNLISSVFSNVLTIVLFYIPETSLIDNYIGCDYENIARSYLGDNTIMITRLDVSKSGVSALVKNFKYSSIGSGSIIAYINGSYCSDISANRRYDQLKSWITNYKKLQKCSF